MKAILMSIRQKHLVKILNGEKTVEIRKIFPKDFVGFVYLYCAKDKLHSDNTLLTITGEEDLNGKVVARFWLEKSEKLLCHKFSDNKVSYGLEETIEGNFGLERMTGLSITEIHEYLKGENGHALHINNLEMFDKPKELRDFYKNNIPYVAEKEIKHAIETNDIEALNSYKITKAPQSWMYVEVIE